MIKANRKRGTKGGLIIPEDKFKEFEVVQKREGGRKIKEIGGSSKGRYIRTMFGYTGDKQNFSANAPKLRISAVPLDEIALL